MYIYNYTIDTNKQINTYDTNRLNSCFAWYPTLAFFFLYVVVTAVVADILIASGKLTLETMISNSG